MYDNNTHILPTIWEFGIRLPEKNVPSNDQRGLRLFIQQKKKCKKTKKQAKKCSHSTPVPNHYSTRTDTHPRTKRVPVDRRRGFSESIPSCTTASVRQAPSTNTSLFHRRSYAAAAAFARTYVNNGHNSVRGQSYEKTLQRPRLAWTSTSHLPVTEWYWL